MVQPSIMVSISLAVILLAVAIILYLVRNTGDQTKRSFSENLSSFYGEGILSCISILLLISASIVAINSRESTTVFRGLR